MQTNKIKYAISSGHHLTSKVIEEVMLAGGNAYDGLIAGFCAMTITEPAMASMLAGGFVNVLESNGKNFILDFFCQTPINKRNSNNKYDEIIVDFGESQETFYAGPASIAVSGAVKMIHYFLRYYCKLPLKELVQPAMSLANDGVKLTDFQAEDLQLLRHIFGLNSSGRDIFFVEERCKGVGENIQMKEFGDFLDYFANQPAEWFYKDHVAKEISKYCTEAGGALTMMDFSEYELHFSTPHEFEYANKTCSVVPLPSLGGGLLHLFLNTLSKSNYSFFSKEHTEALLNGFDNCYPFLKDGQKLFSKLNGDSEQGNTPTIIPGGTSHFNILDKYGNAVSLSVSIGEGSGFFVPGTQIHANNMLGETALLPSGLDSWIPNTRLNSMMCPTFVFGENRELELMCGTGGATRIPFSIAQVLDGYYRGNLELLEAIHAPRMYKKAEVCYAEKGLDLSGVASDVNLKVWSDLELLFGGVHAISIKDSSAFGDSRREGDAIITYY